MDKGSAERICKKKWIRIKNENITELCRGRKEKERPFLPSAENWRRTKKFSRLLIVSVTIKRLGAVRGSLASRKKKRKQRPLEKQGRPRRAFLARKIRSKWFEFLSSERRMAGAISEYWCVTLRVSMGDWLVFYCLSSLTLSPSSFRIFLAGWKSERKNPRREISHEYCNSVQGSCAEYPTIYTMIHYTLLNIVC